MKVCILDDTEIVVDLLANLLAGHQVFKFTQPESFIAAIKPDVDVIITDLKVARYDAIKNIRRFKETNIACKVIVISAYFTEDNLFDLIDCHIYTAIRKTHEFEWLQKVVDAVNK